MSVAQARATGDGQPAGRTIEHVRVRGLAQGVPLLESLAAQCASADAQVQAMISPLAVSFTDVLCWLER